MGCHDTGQNKPKRASYLLLVLFAVFSATAGAEETLTLAYHPHPGLASTVEGKPVGQYLVAAHEIVERAGLTANWAELPQTRLISYLKENKPNFCAVGFYKTDDRAVFAKYSNPFHRDARDMVVASRRYADKIIKYKTFNDLTNDRTLHIAVEDGRSYGKYLDNVLKDIGKNIDVRVLDVKNLYLMTAAGRLDYFIGEPEEYKVTLQEIGLSENDFVLIDFPDMPQGNLRHFLCSKATDDSVIARLNAAISAYNIAKP